MENSICCGKEMRVNINTTLFVELKCDVCNDFIYIKKDRSLEPELIDD